MCLNHLYRPQSVFALQKALTETPVKVAAKPRAEEPRSWLGALVSKLKKNETT
jgi:hypothetical protein